MFFLIPFFAHRMSSFFLYYLKEKYYFPLWIYQIKLLYKIMKELLSLVKKGNHTINPVPCLPFIGGSIVFLNVISVSAFFYAILIT